jgi:thioredoxin 1
MAIFDTPITSDDKNLKKVLGQKQPALLILYQGTLDKPLDDAIRKEAKRYAGELLVVRVDAKENRDTLLKYGEPNLPALVTLTENNWGRKVKSDAENIRPKDVRDHIRHLLEDQALPEQKVLSGKNKRPIAVTDATFRNEVLKSKVPVLVDFWAEWCGPCHQIAPQISKIAEEYGDKIKVAKLDVDHNRVISERYSIQSIPTMIVFEGGQPAARISGANPVALRKMVERFTS